jgi:hypothetical protein
LQFELQRRLVGAKVPAPAWPSPSARIGKLLRKCDFALPVTLIVGSILFILPAFAWSAPGNRSPRAAAGASTADPPAPTPDAKLALRVYNYARIDPVSLALSEKMASAIFENVGVEIAWVDCSVSRPTSTSLSRPSPACQSDMGSTDLVLRILPRNMAIKLAARNDPLGFAQICMESEPACELNVFYHRVDELAVNGYRTDRILGYVIAHEVTHVLLGPGHSEEGVMRGQWTRDDLQRISWGQLLDFTSDQSKQLRYAVLRRMKQPVPDNPTRANSVAP